MEIFINGRDARLFASQGQQRTAMLAIKLGCARIAEKSTGEAPILLLDDVFSELDVGRRERLLSLTGSNGVLSRQQMPPEWRVFRACSFLRF